MKRSKILFLIVSIIAVFGMTFSVVSAEPVTVTDILGREVTVNVPPALTVIAGKKTSTISELPFMFNYGLGHVVTPKTAHDKGAFISLFENSAPLMADESVEGVAALKPELLLMKSYTREDSGAAFEQTGIPVVYLNLESYPDYQQEIALLGKLFGEEARADELLAYYAGIVSNVEEMVSAAPEKKSVLLVQYSASEGTYSLKVPPMSWIQTSLVTMAGGQPVWEEVGAEAKTWTDVNFEQIAAWDPDVVLVVDYAGNPSETVEKLKGEPGWNLLRAVKDNQIFGFRKDTSSWDFATPRWGLGLLWTAKTLYPELTAEIDLDAEVLRFYKWFGLSDAVIQEKLIDAYQMEPVAEN